MRHAWLRSWTPASTTPTSWPPTCAKCTKLALETGVGAVMEVIDVMAILAGSQDGPILAEDGFATSLPGASLELAGPLVSGSGLDQLAPDDVEILPSPSSPRRQPNSG